MLISGDRRHQANIPEKYTFSVGRSPRMYSCGTVLNSSSFSCFNFEPYPSDVIYQGGRVGLSSVPHCEPVAYKSYI